MNRTEREALRAVGPEKLTTMSSTRKGTPRSRCSPTHRHTDTPTGMTGNDDLGTMSSWMVLSAIGISPVQPGTDSWGLSTPVFDRVDLTLDRRWYPHGRFTVTAPGTSDTSRYVQSVRLDGAAYDKTYLTTADIRRASDLTLTTGNAPSTWGTAPSAAPQPSTDQAPTPVLSSIAGRAHFLSPPGD